MGRVYRFTLLRLFFPSQHYTKDADGLCTRLIQPLQKKGENFFSVSADEFKKGGWEIDKREVDTGELIGKGEFGGKIEKPGHAM